MRKIERTIEQMLTAAGYWVKRRGKHLVWTNGKDIITTSISPSDHRALKKIEQNIRAQARAG